MKIKVLNHKDINLTKWDNCVLNSINGRHYAMSWYLDIVSSGWKGLIAGDYVAVMPIPVKYKIGLPMIMQPFMTQQLGIFSKKELEQELINCFYKKLQQKNPIIYNLNPYFKPSILQKENIKLLPNIELHLNKKYSDLIKNYSKNTKRNIAKAHKHSLSIKESANYEKLFDFYFENLRFKYSTKEKKLFKMIVYNSLKRNEGLWFSVTNEKGIIITAAFFVIFKNRVTFLGSSSSEEGYEKFAAFFLFDKVIEQFSGDKYILDFEGSQTEGIARFYQGFGGEKNNYIQLFNKYLTPQKIINLRNFILKYQLLLFSNKK